MIWPLAALEVVRGSEGASAWSAVHARQALVFGLLGTLGFIVLLALPLIVSLSPANLGARATIGVYAVALPLDAVYALVSLAFAIRWSARAARGDLFAIPVVSRIADGVFAKRHP